MKWPISRGSAVLLALGTLAVLLLGAFTRSNTVAPPDSAVAAVASESDTQSQPVEDIAPATFTPGLAEVVKLAQNHVDEGVILAFIRNSGLTYSPTAEEILYLNDLGLSQKIIAALVKQTPTAAPATLANDGEGQGPAALPVPNFYKSLAPYGNWLHTTNYGLCWQPTAATVNPDWRPYVDDGQWDYTDNGWSWQSGYSWGSIAFHYGRWTQNASAGWLWVPDNTWGPAWVSWRIASDYSGWAPLPPGVSLAIGEGLAFNDMRVADNFDFGIPAGWYTFVAPENLLSPDLAAYIAQASQITAIYNRSVTVNNYSNVKQKIINHGPGPSSIATSAPGIPLPAAISPAPPPRHKLEEAARIVADSVSLPTLADVDSPREPLALPATPAPLWDVIHQTHPIHHGHHHAMDNPPSIGRLAFPSRQEMFAGHDRIETHQQELAPHLEPMSAPVAGHVDSARLLAVASPPAGRSGK